MVRRVLKFTIAHLLERSLLSAGYLCCWILHSFVMRFQVFVTLACLAASTSAAVIRRQSGQQPTFEDGQPINANGSRGAPISGGTNHELDLQNPDGLGRQSTDSGTVPNLKWSFSLSRTRIFPGGWTRTQVIQDLPQSHDIAAAQQHLHQGAIRELHWHKVVSGFCALVRHIKADSNRLSGASCTLDESSCLRSMNMESIMSKS